MPPDSAKGSDGDAQQVISSWAAMLDDAETPNPDTQVGDDAADAADQSDDVLTNIPQYTQLVEGKSADLHGTVRTDDVTETDQP
jgi:hypothetical protein